jgi:chromosome segregation ATPase
MVSKIAIVSIAALGFVGAAQASCTSDQTKLVKLGGEIQSLQADREQVVSDFEYHNDERAAARNDLSMLKMTGGDSEEAAVLEAKVEEHHTSAEALKLELDELNTELMEKADTYNKSVAAFNKKCG